ncbi:MAG: HAD family phosphatase [Anaerolineaceae bacterium]|jgi:epoxide hydrolase-like predicted phosphatase
MVQSIKAVIWDMGGVLLRSEDPQPRAKLAQRFGLTSDELSHRVFEGQAAALATLGKITDEELWRLVAAGVGAPESEAMDIATQFFAGDRLDQPLVDFIRSLRPRFQTGLLSNAWPGARQMLTEHYPCIDAFDVAVISAEVGMAKPDQRIFQLITERLGVRPPEAVFIDDFSVNIDGARSAGLNAIHFRSHDQVLQELGALLER